MNGLRKLFFYICLFADRFSSFSPHLARQLRRMASIKIYKEINMKKETKWEKSILNFLYQYLFGRIYTLSYLRYGCFVSRWLPHHEQTYKIQINAGKCETYQMYVYTETLYYRKLPLNAISTDSRAVRISHTTTHIIHMNDKRWKQMQARVQTMMCVIFFQMSNYFVNKKDERTEQQSGGIT